MRKTFVVVLIALLVMLAVSCDSNLAGENDDGLVTLSIDTGGLAGSRSITDTQAKKEANNVEVIVKGIDNKFYRATGLRDDPITLRVPPGIYNNTNTLLLIGRRSDGTLLAVGTATNTVTLPYAAGADKLTLTATSLTTTLTAGAVGCNFVIDPTSVPAADHPAFYPNSTSVLDKGVFLDDDSTPCFQVPTGIVVPADPDDNEPIKASLTIVNSSLATIGNRIIVVPKAKTTDPDPVKFTPVNGPAINPINVTTDMSTGKIAFEFNTSTTPGKYRITFFIPVVGFSSTYEDGTGTKPLTWHIQGGTEAGSDFGDTDFIETATKEGVPLLVTDTPKTPKYSLPGEIEYWD
jgi:hypothetical protein